jgi:phosphinothricin acetyltransferase
MLIRLANNTDLAAILDISNWAALNTPANFAIDPETLKTWTQSFDQSHRMFPWLVAEREGVILGFAKASPHRGRCAYAWTAEVSVYVHPDHHGKGVGTHLYQRLISILKAQGYITLLAGITTPNLASERLHQSFGFHKIGVFERVGWKFNRWHDVGYWEAFLRQDELSPEPIQPVNDVAGAVLAGHM